MSGNRTETSLTVTTQAGGISLRDIIFILFRRRWVVLAISLPIILVGGSSLFSQTGSFTASAKVLVELTKVDLPQWNVSGRNIDYDRELSTLFTIAMSVPVADKAAASLEDSLPVIRSLDPNLATLEKGTDFTGFLLGNLDVSVVGESNVLEFRFSSADPRISLMAVGALRDAFIEYQVHGRKDRKAVQFYEEQMHAVRSQMDSLLSIRGQILRANNYISLKDELKFDSGLLADLKGELNKATIDRKSLEAHYRELLPYLDGDPRDFPMGPDENRANSLVFWRNTVGEHDDQLSSILTVYTVDSDVAKRKQQMIDEAVARLGNEERSYVQSIQVAAQALRGKEAALKDQIAELRVKTENSPDIYQKVSLIDNELSSLQGLQKDVQGKLGEVRLNEFADERVSNVESLTSPELSTILSGSKTMLYFVLIVLFSVAIGVVVAFLLESMDHRVYEPRDVEDHLQLPVFASVTKVK